MDTTNHMKTQQDFIDNHPAVQSLLRLRRQFAGPCGGGSPSKATQKALEDINGVLTYVKTMATHEYNQRVFEARSVPDPFHNAGI